MKYVYAVLTVIEDKPFMQTHVSPKRLTGREILDILVLTDEERRRYQGVKDENQILMELNLRQRIRVEVQEVEV